MKKVWILEKFETYEEMVKHHADYEEWLEDAKVNDTNMVAHLETLIEKHKELMKNNPNGRWYGFDGKTIYHQFCDYARTSLRCNPHGKFRVVEGEIEDDATNWIGYKMVKENEGVLRYLMATK